MVGQAFVMCRSMFHRICIATLRDRRSVAAIRRPTHPHRPVIYFVLVNGRNMLAFGGAITVTMQ
jgi:hypothetical protein